MEEDLRQKEVKESKESKQSISMVCESESKHHCHWPHDPEILAALADARWDLIHKQTAWRLITAILRSGPRSLANEIAAMWECGALKTLLPPPFNRPEHLDFSLAELVLHRLHDAVSNVSITSTGASAAVGGVGGSDEEGSQINAITVVCALMQFEKTAVSAVATAWEWSKSERMLATFLCSVLTPTNVVQNQGITMEECRIRLRTPPDNLQPACARASDWLTEVLVAQFRACDLPELAQLVPPYFPVSGKDVTVASKKAGAEISGKDLAFTLDAMRRHWIHTGCCWDAATIIDDYFSKYMHMTLSSN